MKTKMIRLAAVALAVAALAPVAQAQTDGNWEVRLRAVNIDPANDNDNLDVSINKKLIPEFDISYYFTPNIAAELILTYPQKHNVKLNGSVIGSVKHLPPTLTVQYHFMPDSTAFRPYVGAGVNYTNFTAVDLPSGLNLDRGSWGLAFQAGADIPLAKQWYLNVDIKKVYIRTDVNDATGAKLDTFKIDPLLVGVGIGYRF